MAKAKITDKVAGKTAVQRVQACQIGTQTRRDSEVGRRERVCTSTVSMAGGR